MLRFRLPSTRNHRLADQVTCWSAAPDPRHL